MFYELTGDPHDSSAVQSALRLQLRQARLAKKKPTWSRSMMSYLATCLRSGSSLNSMVSVNEEHGGPRVETFYSWA